jgi:threonine dehydratase
MSQITPHEEYPKLAEAVFGGKSNTRLFFKREDMHPLGSHKGRSIPHMIDVYMSTGTKRFVISSSGNAALAAAKYISTKDDIELDILVGTRISPRKRAKIEEYLSDRVRISSHERPLQALFMKTRDPEIKALRQSNDDLALKGYAELAKELMLIPDLSAVFIGTSSGTTAEALAEAFVDSSKKIEVHIVQTTTCHPIAETFNEEKVSFGAEEIDGPSLADAIVDHTAIRKNRLTPLIEETGGSGWIATNSDIRTAMDMVKNNADMFISSNSALSLVGLSHAVYTGRTWTGSIACLICGD